MPQATQTTATKKRLTPSEGLPVQHRQLQIDRRQIDEEARTVELAFSSETPVDRWYGREILDHGEGAVRLERIRNGGPLLMDHDSRDHVGIMEEISLDGRVGRARVRFGRGARASEVFQDVLDGIRQHVSVGYRIHAAVLQETGDDGDVYRMTDWEPLEVSLVSVPADPSVGVGRSAPPQDNMNAFPFSFEDRTMEDEIETTDATRSEGGAAPAPQATREPAPAGSGAREVDPQEGVLAERARIKRVMEAGGQYGARELAMTIVERGGDVDELRKALLEKRHGENAGAADEIPTAPVEIGLTEREADKFSFVRLMHARAAGEGDSRAQKAAAFELDVVRTAAEALPKVDDIREARSETVIPHDVLSRPLTQSRAVADAVLSMIGGGRRDLVVGTASAGGNLVATDLLGASFIDILRNSAVTMQVATVLTDLVGNVAIPRQTAAATAGWLATEQGAASESNATFDQLSLSPKEVGAFSNYSRRLLIQSAIEVEAFVRMDLATGIGLAVDLAALVGSGASGEPTGITNTTGVGAVEIDTNGGAITWGTVVDLETEVAVDNALLNRLAYMTNARVRGAMKQTEKASGTARFIMEPGMELNGYSALISNQVPSNLTKGSGTNLSAMIFGNWADLIIAMWSGVDLLVNPYTGDTTRTTRVTAYQDADIGVRHPESFAVCDDIA